MPSAFMKAGFRSRTNLENRYVFGVFSDRADDLPADLEKTATMRGRVESLLMPIIHTGHVEVDGSQRKSA